MEFKKIFKKQKTFKHYKYDMKKGKIGLFKLIKL